MLVLNTTESLWTDSIFRHFVAILPVQPGYTKRRCYPKGAPICQSRAGLQGVWSCNDPLRPRLQADPLQPRQSSCHGKL
jgi:hypothetical protein